MIQAQIKKSIHFAWYFAHFIVPLPTNWQTKKYPLTKTIRKK
jgi:hypothetical protein